MEVRRVVFRSSLNVAAASPIGPSPAAAGSGAASATGGRAIRDRRRIIGIILRGQGRGALRAVPYRGNAFAAVNAAGDAASRAGAATNAYSAATTSGSASLSGWARLEERRVGKEGGSTCRSRWSQYH